MKSDQSKQTKPSSKDSEIEEQIMFMVNPNGAGGTYEYRAKAILSLVDQYTQSKLKAFAGEFEKAIGEDEYPEQHFPTVLQGENIEKYDKVTARDRLRAELRQALKAIKGKFQL